MIKDTNGRFCVEMPMKDNDIELGQSKSTASRRLKMLERRFVREPIQKINMSNFYKNTRILIACRELNMRSQHYIITFLPMLWFALRAKRLSYKSRV
ncbi:hypothetical protein TNIN_324261 [Trichonephila inaurata madagascariensis]|uniref:Uncharacterized protein n=1 Tax=Trichonephila inaurata madagascariensis TaxID=2747483 RepID=A0A8X6YM80_9ARAC|nr:hypothetical protein TNIN_324261 [Trichonephila inaurata madagascariensis]